MFYLPCSNNIFVLTTMTVVHISCVLQAKNKLSDP